MKRSKEMRPVSSRALRIGLAWFDPADPTDWAVAGSLARELTRLGHSALVVGPRRRRGDPPFERRQGIAIRRVGGPGISMERCAQETLDLARRERLDAWHCHVFGRSFAPFLEALGREPRPLIATLHLVLPDYLPHAGGSAVLRALLRRASRITAVSRASRAELLALAPRAAGKTSVVYNGLSSSPRAARVKESARKPYLLSVARLAPYKGTDVLLMAYARLVEEFPALRLVLCGRDQLRGGAARFAAALGVGASVAFAGERSPAEVSRFMRGCVAFVLPSRRENLPLALMEAMAAGKPCAAAAVGGVPELARHGKEALLVPAGDVDALTRALAALLRDPALRRRLGRSARQRSRTWTWARACRDYVRLYREALAELS